MATQARPVGALEEIPGQPQAADEEGQTQEVKGDVTGEGDAEDDRLVHRLALQAAGHVLPPGEDLLDDHREGEGGDGEIDAGHAHRGQPDDHARRRRQRRGQGQGHDPRQAEVLGEVHVGVGADAQERGVAKTHQPRVAGQHHEGQAAEPVDEDEADVDEVLGHQARQEEEADEEGGVAVALDAVAKEPEVLKV